MLILRICSRRPYRLTCMSLWKPSVPSNPTCAGAALCNPYLRRCFASEQARPSRLQEELQRQARAASKGDKKDELPERILIYHAGTGRTTFLAMLKVTSLFLGAFFGFIVVPSYVKADKPTHEIAGVALCGIIPILFVSLAASPFVTHIHMHLPPYARASRPILERFVRALPPSTRLTVTTMSAIAKPRYSTLAAADLDPVVGRRRFGLVNYVRGRGALQAENARRRWYMFRAVGRFYVQERGQAAPRARRRYQKPAKKDLVEGWVWDALREKLHARAAAKSA